MFLDTFEPFYQKNFTNYKGNKSSSSQKDSLEFGLFVSILHVMLFGQICALYKTPTNLKQPENHVLHKKSVDPLEHNVLKETNSYLIN